MARVRDNNNPTSRRQCSVLFTPTRLWQKYLTGQFNGGIAFFPRSFRVCSTMTGRTWQSSRVQVAGKQETEGARNQTTLRSLPLMIYFQLATTPRESLLPQTVPSAGDKHVAHQAVGPWTYEHLHCLRLWGWELPQTVSGGPTHCQCLGWFSCCSQVWQFLKRLNIS